MGKGLAQPIDNSKSLQRFMPPLEAFLFRSIGNPDIFPHALLNWKEVKDEKQRLPT